MKRRALLGTLASFAVAGCTGTASEPTTSTTTQTTTANPSTTTQTTVPAVTPPELRTLGVPATESDCPLGDEGRAVCYPEHSDAILSLTPAADALDLPMDSTTFTLANDTDHEYRTNFYGWKLSKRVDGEWFHVAPRFYPEPLHVLPAGESHEWSFTVDNTQSPVGGASSDQDVTLAGLGGGDPVELTPTDGVSTTRDGDTVVVTVDDNAADGEVMTAFVVARSEVPPEQPIERRISEQLLRPDPWGRLNPYRNTLPFFEDDVETVRLEAPADDTSPFGVDEPYYLGYDDETYRVSTKRLE